MTYNREELLQALGEINDKPLSDDDLICVCGHPKSRHVMGHSVKRCNGVIPSSTEDIEIGGKSYCQCRYYKFNHVA